MLLVCLDLVHMVQVCFITVEVSIFMINGALNYFKKCSKYGDVQNEYVLIIIILLNSVNFLNNFQKFQWYRTMEGIKLKFESN